MQQREKKQIFSSRIFTDVRDCSNRIVLSQQYVQVSDDFQRTKLNQSKEYNDEFHRAFVDILWMKNV